MYFFQYLLGGILSFLVGYYILSQRPKTLALKSLLLYSFVTGLWEFSVFFSKTVAAADLAATFWIVTMLTSHLGLPLYLFMILNIQGRRDWRSLWVFIPFVTQGVLILQEKYQVNFEFIVTELGWSYHVVSY